MHAQEHEKPQDVLLQRQKFIKEIVQIIVTDFNNNPVNNLVHMYALNMNGQN